MPFSVHFGFRNHIKTLKYKVYMRILLRNEAYLDALTILFANIVTFQLYFMSNLHLSPTYS